MVKRLPQVTQREEELMRKWKKEGRPITEIMTLTGRCKQTVYDHVAPIIKKKTEPTRTGSGRPPLITALSSA